MYAKLRTKDEEAKASAIAGWNTRASPGEQQSAKRVAAIIKDRAQQACRYAFKHQEFSRDEEGYLIGWETAVEVCEEAIERHIAQHLVEDLARAFNDLPS